MLAAHKINRFTNEKFGDNVIPHNKLWAFDNIIFYRVDKPINIKLDRTLMNGLWLEHFHLSFYRGLKKIQGSLPHQALVECSSRRNINPRFTEAADEEAYRRYKAVRITGSKIINQEVLTFQVLSSPLDHHIPFLNFFGFAHIVLDDPHHLITIIVRYIFLRKEDIKEVKDWDFKWEWFKVEHLFLESKEKSRRNWELDSQKVEREGHVVPPGSRAQNRAVAAIIGNDCAAAQSLPAD
ncbi:hypothetical protein IEQ34_002004 [Dendrobium chrysotoxum]|uniref:Uncharacterized protein n=1 Tax=Dendrobium chrysotoxum TaxID=161865 RepID=A0AAV7HK50_DENCH|nr:hypothetical protein IEQ34_002004 [Dendrobium chrysotoxum]